MLECETLGGESFARAEGPNGAATPLWEMEGCHAGAQECHTTFAGRPGQINNLYAWFEEPFEAGQSPPGWKGRLGWIEKSSDPPRVGMQYTAANRERLFGLILCGGPIGIVWIGGEPGRESSIVASIAPVDKMTSAITETFAQASPGVPEPARLEHRKAPVLGAFFEGRWEPVALTASFSYGVESSSGEIEIRARR